MTTENLSPQRIKAERWIVWVYVWLFVSVFISVTWTLANLASSSGKAATLPARSSTSKKDATLPVWSPTRREIAVVSDRDGASSLYIVQPDSKSVRRLVDVHRDLPDISCNFGCARSYAWSPDGDQIVFVSNHEGDDNLYVINTDGSGMRRLTDSSRAGAAAPAWSPDGKRIAFVSRYLYVTDVGGREVTRLTQDTVSDNEELTWSPDSRHIAFELLSRSPYRVYMVSVEGGEAKSVEAYYQRDILPAWSPDGSQIAFSSGVSGREWIHVQNPDGSQVQSLLDQSVYGFSPVWSPDGKRIAFWSYSSSLYTMNADGSKVKQAVSLDGICTVSCAPTWSPDSRQVAVVAKGDLYVVNADGSGLSKVFEANPTPRFVTAVFTPLVVYLVLVLGLLFPSAYARLHTLQALALAAAQALSALIFLGLMRADQQGQIGWFIVSGLCLVLGFVAGLQALGGECWLMRFIGRGTELPRPWAQAPALAPSGEGAVPQPGFLRRWILANTLGWALSVGLLFGSIGFVIVAVFLPPVFGFLGTWLLYLLQVRVLQRELGQEAARKFAKASWIGAGATLAAEALLSAMFITFLGLLGMSYAKPDLFGTIIFLAIPGVPLITAPFLAGWLTSRAQWRSVFKVRFAISESWTIANVLGWGLSWLIGLACLVSVVFLNLLRTFDLSGPMDWVPVGGVLGLLVGSVIGLVNSSATGLALIGMFKHPLPPAPIEQTTPDSSRSIT